MPSRFPFSSSVFSAFSFSACVALSLPTFGTAFAATPVLVLNTDSDAQDAQAPALDRALARFAGVASGSYFWSEGLVAEQLIAGLSASLHRQQLALPGDVRLLSSYRRVGGGGERAAVMVDGRGEVLAAALAHRGCGADGKAACRGDDQHAELVVFLRPGFDRAKAQPLLAWSTQVPKEDMDSGEPEKIVRTDYITLDAAHTAAPPVKRPKGFSAKVPLYPRAVIYRTGQDALSDEKARRVLRLQTTDSIAQVLAFYKQLTPPLAGMESGAEDRTGYVLGSRDGVSFSVNAKQPRNMPVVTNIEIEISE